MPFSAISSSRDLDDLADVGDQDVLVRNAGRDRQLLVEHQHPVLAVDRHAVLRAEQVQHVRQLVLAGMAGDVHALVDRPVDDLGAAPVQVVDRPSDGLLVAGDRAGAEDDRVCLDDP